MLLLATQTLAHFTARVSACHQLSEEVSASLHGSDSCSAWWSGVLPAPCLYSQLFVLEPAPCCLQQQSPIVPPHHPDGIVSLHCHTAIMVTPLSPCSQPGLLLYVLPDLRFIRLVIVWINMDTQCHEGPATKNGLNIFNTSRGTDVPVCARGRAGRLTGSFGVSQHAHASTSGGSRRVGQGRHRRRRQIRTSAKQPLVLETQPGAACREKRPPPRQGRRSSSGLQAELHTELRGHCGT